MNNLQIEKIISCVDIGKNEKFLGVFPSDKIPVISSIKGTFSLIANTDDSTQGGTHWVAFFRSGKDIIEYFDSFGRKPYIKSFTDFLNYQKFIYNNISVQSPLTNVCGQYCIFYILARHFDLPFINIINLFKNEGDIFITKFINNFFSLDLKTYDIEFLGKQISLCQHQSTTKS